jgi:DNA-binding beta-propeller fold protein YncE
MRSAFFALVSFLSLGLAGWSCRAADAPAYHLAHEVPIPGDEFWDYLSFDSTSGRLFVSHGTRVQVVDGSKLAVVGEVPDTPGVHGVAVAPDLGRGFISAGRSGSLIVFDLKTLQRLAEVKTTGDNPDAVLYDPATHRVFTFNGRGRNITAVDAVKNSVIGTIPLDAGPEFAAADGTGHLYLNLEDKNSLAQIDARGLKVERVTAIPGCDGPSGLAMDRVHRRVFSVCSNKVMAVIDADTGRTVTTLPISEHVDAAAFDPGTQLAFASGGDGTVTIVSERSPEQFSVVQSVHTKAGARTMALDERTHRVFLVTAQVGPPPAPTPEQPRPRRTIVPGSFEMLVLEP